MAILNTAGNASVRGYGFTTGGVSKVLISSTPGPAATITTYSGYIVFKFTGSATLNVGAGTPGTADVFVVAGGSGGLAGTGPPAPPPSQAGGSGGNGGTRTESPAFAITANSPIPVVVGGASTNSTFGPVTSSGGTAGGLGGVCPGNAVAGNPGSPGPTNNYETGSPQEYGGGGGAGSAATITSVPSGGISGGGSGGKGAINNPLTPADPGSPGAANTGGGGGGGGGGINSGTKGGASTGGSGVVIIRFPDAQFRTS